jgi:hypothetical protein
MVDMLALRGSTGQLMLGRGQSRRRQGPLFLWGVSDGDPLIEPFGICHSACKTIDALILLRFSHANPL